MSDSHFHTAAISFATARVAQLRQLSYEQARALPECAGEDVLIDGVKSSLTVFRQSNTSELAGETLITVLIARSVLFGVSSYHIERGVVFSPIGPVREATSDELQNSGG